MASSRTFFYKVVISGKTEVLMRFFEAPVEQTISEALKKKLLGLQFSVYSIYLFF